MSDSFEDLLAERNRIVHRLTELNSEQLTHQSRRAGVEFEMLTVDDALEQSGGAMTAERAAQVDALEREHRAIKEKVEAIDRERMALTERLEDLLARIDATQ